MNIKILKKIYLLVCNYELRWLNKRAIKYGFKLEQQNSNPHAEIVLTNYFNTNFKKNALLSYLIDPFLNAIKNNHSNNKECYILAEILNELQFNVDIINWDNTTMIPSKSYDLVIDNHNNLERFSTYLDAKTLKIFHATNAHWLFQNWVEYGRHHTFFLQTGVSITPPRLNVAGNSAEYCNYITMFGNEFTKNINWKVVNFNWIGMTVESTSFDKRGSNDFSIHDDFNIFYFTNFLRLYRHLC